MPGGGGEPPRDSQVPEVVVVSARGDARCLVAVPLHDLEAEDVPVEGERAVDVRDLEVDVSDVDGGVDAHGSTIPRI